MLQNSGGRRFQHNNIFIFIKNDKVTLFSLNTTQIRLKKITSKHARCVFTENTD